MAAIRNGQMLALKDFVKSVPIVGGMARRIYQRLRSDTSEKLPFPGSGTYWEGRYAKGETSGVGSYGKFAEFKADMLNSFVNAERIASVMEFGCGDGNQLRLATYPRYIGFDVSTTAIGLCREKFSADSTKSFRSLDTYAGETADLTLSLDVIYHLVEDHVFEDHMRRLFSAARRYVIIYSSDKDETLGNADCHVRHRKFTTWVEANIDGWSLDRRVPNKYPYEGDYKQGSFADFYIYRKNG
jgi:SAM-dependent methyltransferase